MPLTTCSALRRVHANLSKIFADFATMGFKTTAEFKGASCGGVEKNRGDSKYKHAYAPNFSLSPVVEVDQQAMPHTSER
jgi:hypothetical protein